MIAEFHGREKEMAKRFDAWIANGSRIISQHIPICGNAEQVLAEARADADEAKDAVLTAMQDLGNKH